MEESKIWRRKIGFFLWIVGLSYGLIFKNMMKSQFSANLTGNL
jgi:hypothetical protein